jgi:hypothetical protein
MSGFQQTTGVYGFAGGMGGISYGGAPGVLVNGNTFGGSGFSSIGTYGGGGAGGNTAIASGSGNWSGGGGAAGGYLEGWIPVSLLVGASTVTVAVGGTIPGGVLTPGNSLEGTSGANGACIIEAYY